MMTLQESVDARRAEKPAEMACVSAAAQVPTVLVSVWEGWTWALPWSNLIAAWTDGAVDNEELHLSFTDYIVIATGRNLRRVMDDIAGFRVTSLRSVPPEFAARFAADAPLITRIEVRALDASAPRTLDAS